MKEPCSRIKPATIPSINANENLIILHTCKELSLRQASRLTFAFLSFFGDQFAPDMESNGADWRLEIGWLGWLRAKVISAANEKHSAEGGWGV